MPMVVWKHHGPTPPEGDIEHMLAQLSRVADARFGAGEWSVDRVMRQIPNHFHAHGRDPNWWFRLAVSVDRRRCHAATRHRRPAEAPQGGDVRGRLGCPRWRSPATSRPTSCSTPIDPGGGAMGTLGADGSVETNWFALLHRRVTDRAVRSPRYQWWALSALLAGLLSLNITFTVFVVALPDRQGGLPHQLLGAGLGLDRTAAGLRRGGALLRQGGRPLRPPPALPVRPARGHGQRRPHGDRARRRHAALRPGPRRRAGRRHRHRLDGDHPRALLTARTGSRRWAGGRWSAPAAPCSA